MSSVGSPPGASSAGAATAAVSASATAPEPIVPVAGRAPGAAIVHVYLWDDARVASHVQSTSVPAPEPCAAVTPLASVTVTVHASDALSLPLKRTGPPSFPSACGAYSFGPPSAATSFAICGSSA